MGIKNKKLICFRFQVFTKKLIVSYKKVIYFCTFSYFSYSKKSSFFLEAIQKARSFRVRREFLKSKQLFIMMSFLLISIEQGVGDWSKIASFDLTYFSYGLLFFSICFIVFYVGKHLTSYCLLICINL